MSGKYNEDIKVEVNMLVENFLKLLQRDGAIANGTYLKAVKILKEEQKNVNSN